MIVKTFSKCAAVVVLAMSAGCAAAPADEPAPVPAEEAFASVEAALTSGHLPTHTAVLEVRATDTGTTTMLDVTTNQLPVLELPEGTPQPFPDPHLSDTFVAVKVYLEDASGRRAIASLNARDFYGPQKIGPGGGCIHFSVPRLHAGDKIFVAGIVDLDEDTIGARIAAAPVLTVTAGEWDPEIFEFEDHHDHDH